MKTKTTNPKLRNLVNKFENEGRKRNLPFLVDLSERLSKSRKNRAEVNISKLNRLANKGDTIVVPGKVLGYGKLDKKLDVVSFKFSGGAREKIEGAGGNCLKMKEFLNKEPDGKNIRIME